MYLQVNHLNGQPEAAKVFPTLIKPARKTPAFRPDSYPHVTNGFCEMAYQANSYGRLYHNLYHLVPLYKRAKKDVGKNQAFRHGDRRAVPFGA
jgi:hypothetical protein